MPLAEALTLLTVSDRADAVAILDGWATAAMPALQASENFRQEAAFDNPHYRDFLQTLVRKKADLNPVAPVTKDAFRAAATPHALRGISAVIPAGTILGRAIILEKYVRHVLRTLQVDMGFGGETESSVRDALVEIFEDTVDETNVAYAHYFEALRLTLVGKDIVFATFRDDSTLFDPPLNTADSVRNALGLGLDDVGKPYILLRYALPAASTAFVPTVADTLWDYHQYFRPNPSARAERRGWTMPLIPSAIIKQEPEIVHEEIDGTTLAFPFGIAA